MRISEVASILNLSSKEVIQEVESMRDDLTTQGFKLAKRLTASSGLDEEAVKHVLAHIDLRQQEAKKAEEEAKRLREQEEMERRRAAEAQQRAREEEERKRQAEEARKRADEELARRQQEMAARMASQTPAAPQQVAEPTKAPPPPQPVQPKEVVAERKQKEERKPQQRPERQQRDRDEKPRKPKRRDDVDGDSVSDKSLARFMAEGLQSVVSPDQRERRRPPKERRPAGGPQKDDSQPKRRRPKSAPSQDGGKRFRPTQIFNREVVQRRPSPRPHQGGRKSKPSSGQRNQKPQRPTHVVLRGDITVGEFADKLQVPSSEVLKRLILMGEMLTINQVLSEDLAELLATEFEVELDVRPESDEHDVEEYVTAEDSEDDLAPRPPVVTVMGHVDHGKTTLLDRIREANVVEQEHGGITQHIGAYYVKTEKGDLVFLDTPGHEAFTAMRARGANVTDVVVLVVAANDGVKPQTIEAINHAKAAEVPIIIAINKTDVDGANATRVKQELMRFELVSEDLGGDTIMVEVSALRGNGVPELLDMILLQSEVLELQANPSREAIGTVIESHVDPNRGAVATVLIENGTLKQGDHFVAGSISGRVRAMRNDRGDMLKEAGPSWPVEIMGLSGSPGAGEQFVVVPDETQARDIAEKRLVRRKQRSVRGGAPHVTLDNLVDHLTEGEVKSLNLIIKADVQGSVEAIASALLNIKSDKVMLDIIHSGVGAITEGDVQLADASSAIIIGFNVRPETVARDLAAQEGIEIRTYNVIYDLLNDIEKSMVGMLEPVYEEVEMSRVEIRQIFKVTKQGNIAGCFVLEGTVGREHHARLVREGKVIWNGKIQSLRRVKDEVKEVQSGVECGIKLLNFNDIKEGDVIESYTLKEKAATLVSTAKE
ncbi:translation initiation factor IF-2 [bacterium]|nr:translation initiation factor IF-2 [bacterium]